MLEVDSSGAVKKVAQNPIYMILNRPRKKQYHKVTNTVTVQPNLNRRVILQQGNIYLILFIIYAAIFISFK